MGGTGVDLPFDGKSLQLLSQAVARLKDMVVITEAPTQEGEGPRIVFVNPAFTRIMGYAPEDVIGRTPRFMQGGRTQRSELDRIRRALEAGEPVTAQVINYTRAGSEVWLDLDISPIIGENGRPTHWIAIERDITLRKVRELAHATESAVIDMVAAGAGLQPILEKITRAIDSLSPKGRSSILLLNDGERYLSVGAAPNLPQTFSAAIDGLPIGPVAGSCGTAMHRKSRVIATDIATDPLWVPYRRLALDHGLHACRSDPIFGRNGRVIGSLAVYYPDAREPDPIDLALIERLGRVAGNAIERITQDLALRDSEERFRMVARVAADVVWDWDIARGRLWFGEGLSSHFGYEPAEPELGIESWLLRIHPDDRERVDADLRAFVASKRSSWIGEYRLIRADGSVAQVRDRGAVVRDARGLATRMVGSMVDITNEQALQEAVLRSQRMEAMGQLTGGIAHDFNNLLTVILGNAEMLGEALADDPQLGALAGITRMAAERGAELTGSLLAFARKQALDPKPTDVNRLVSGLDGLLRRTLGEHVEIEIVRGGGLWAAMVDGPQLESAILNLCINARDAMPDGGLLTIELANAHLDDAYAAMHDEVSPGQYVLIAVSDTGVGMPAKIAERAFDPFFTTKEMGRGSGLGLSMVHGFVKQSRGHVKIYSEVGEGTSVKLYLPRAHRGATGLEAPSPPARSVRGSGRILLVEDDSLVREHVCDQLSGLGYEVTSVANARAALDLFQQGATFDLLFTDVVMPGGMSGRQLAEAVQQIHPDLPVLFTSGYTENAIVHQGRLDPGVHLLQKPYRRADLAAKVKQVMEQG
ncbi:PAS domain S-box-containing protein [Devosia enhydra]|uniref:histidine kinase n=2 Tax=Devosia enhydra TaxID=665118 RepID=A0A1K2HU43_9HYPH|nr:PAS domain S-box-containing protein [Devosia enhydra]